LNVGPLVTGSQPYVLHEHGRIHTSPNLTAFPIINTSPDTLHGAARNILTD
jgi:hypothetical protein